MIALDTIPSAPPRPAPDRADALPDCRRKALLVLLTEKVTTLITSGENDELLAAVNALSALGGDRS